MKNRLITLKRGVIPGCIPVGPDSHMAFARPPLAGSGKTTLHHRLAELAKKSGSRESSAGATHRRR
jgi:hypothetical protein